ncbi:MAG: hypothetical protein NTX88_05830 [Candidatus Atribacteria bacterium]|nr:hypothetical protein [Candidatus Atribacteria bacterium]
MNSIYTVDRITIKQILPALSSGLWYEFPGTSNIKASDFLPMQLKASYPYFPTNMTSMFDPWSIEQSNRDAVVTFSTGVKSMLVENLGWTREQAKETRLRLSVFEKDWDAPGMELYDEL